ncbi:hypothetical protein [Ruminococcus champanellensis]|uniref:hypothetical protein n=1 Tax=Ruminococcus champanellensis TaxID=1161942 RepID=UPI0002F85AA4|nr:hypothetical protein [Ruminococcus champanellensis]
MKSNDGMIVEATKAELMRIYDNEEYWRDMTLEEFFKSVENWGTKILEDTAE